jgi:hypothetical protein
MIQVSLLFHQLSWCLTLRFSGSPTQLTKQARYRRVSCKRLLMQRIRLIPQNLPFPTYS